MPEINSKLKPWCKLQWKLFTHQHTSAFRICRCYNMIFFYFDEILSESRGVWPFTSRKDVCHCSLCCLHIQYIKIGIAPWVRYHSTKTVAVSDSMLYNRTTICCHGILAVTSSASREARWNSRCACVYSTVNLHGDTNKLSPAVVGAAKGNATKDDSSMCCCNGKSLINFVIYCANITYILPYTFTWKCTSNDCLGICHASLSFRPVPLYMFQKCTVKHCYCVQALSFSSPGLKPSCHLIICEVASSPGADWIWTCLLE